MESYMDQDNFDFEDESPATQETQVDSQPPPSQPESESHLWGFLQDATGSMTRIDLWKITPEYDIGRNTGSTIVFSGLNISSQHCTISWNGNSNDDSAVVVRDYSSNGTYINGKKVGKGRSCILRDGNEIAFGTCIPQLGSKEDYRFIFRHLASEKPTEGIDASYDIGEQLGCGTYGTVVKAICRRTNVWYAVKMIPHRRTLLGEQEKETHSEDMELTREVAIMQQLHHPNVCQLKEVFHDEKAMKLVLEYVDGGNLLDYVLKNNGLYEVDGKHITYQICSALDYMHGKGIVHRDLKPENILLTSHNPPIVKIADFGTSKLAEDGTMLRTLCGSLQYAAPEVLNRENEEGYNHLVDSWSVGVIVFSMLTNANPFIENGINKNDRKVDWSIMRRANVSKLAADFTRSLLKRDPCHRMSMGQALKHPWLRTYNPMYKVDEPMILSPSPRKKSSKGRTVDSKGKAPGETSDEAHSSGYRVLRSRNVKRN